MSDRRLLFSRKLVVNFLISLTLLLTVTACSPPRRVNASDRIFLNLSLEFLDRYELPKTKFKNTPVGGLSAITYDRNLDRFYILSDDRSNLAPARFYTLKGDFRLTEDKSQIKINQLTIEDVTFLRDEEGNTYQPGTIDAEGIALSPRGTIFISSEGDTKKEIMPFIGEFELKTGKKKSNIPIPARYLPAAQAPQGISENLAFESLTLSPNGLLAEDPFRLFTATESALIQDQTGDKSEQTQARIRFLHYELDSVAAPILVAEHLYLLESSPPEVISNGLTELLALQNGHFLSLERTFGFTGAGAKIFQVTIGNATDTSNIASLKGNLSQIQPLKKQLLFDLQDLGFYLDNIEGMTLGPRLPDGSQSLILISDDNFNEEQITQFLLFRCQQL